MTINLTPAAVAFFKAAGVFRVKTEETARVRFDEAYPDFLDGMDEAEAALAYGEAGSDLFAALMERKANDKAAKIAATIASEERRAAKEAAERAKPVTGGMNGARDHVRRFDDGVYVITSAQNNTDVDPSFLASLHTYCKRHGAQLVVGRMTYNKGAFQQPDVDATDGVYYDPAIVPYLVNGTLNLGDRFYMLADANVIPTAKWPTSGFGAESPVGVNIIVPATRIELRTLPALNGGGAKIVAATGAATKRNYILRKTGAQAATAHCIGAIVVNTVTGDIRQLQQMDNETGFYDVDGFYSPDGFRPLAAGDVAAFQPGDIHAEKTSDEAIAAVVKLIQRFKPENVFAHDLLDFSSRNHHNIKDPFFLHAQVVNGATVAGDLTCASDTLDMLANANKRATVHVIVSNHDQAADTWLRGNDWRFDPINAEVYLELALAKVQATKRGDTSHNTLEYAYRNVAGGKATNVVFHALDESVVVAGIEMGSHGHNGANGSKGSPKQFASYGVKMNTGHTHSPSIYGDCYTAGALEMDMGYNVGASSWRIAHTITFANGQRQILFG
jgi:hypothetical protein